MVGGSFRVGGVGREGGGGEEGGGEFVWDWGAVSLSVG